MGEKVGESHSWNIWIHLDTSGYIWAVKKSFQEAMSAAASMYKASGLAPEAVHVT